MAANDAVSRSKADNLAHVAIRSGLETNQNGTRFAPLKRHRGARDFPAMTGKPGPIATLYPGRSMLSCLMISVYARDTRPRMCASETGDAMTWGNRWEWEHTRTSTAGLVSLDVRALKRAGALRAGSAHSWHWTNGRGEPAGDIVTRMDRHGDCLTLDYRTRRYGESEWTPHTQPVWLGTTPCHYGGERVWFTCPGCHGRRAVLFSVGGVFRCRACHDLAYQSTREEPADRARRRLARLYDRLGTAPYRRSGIPPKPPGMYCTTYAGIVRQIRHEYARQAAELRAFLARHRDVLATDEP